MDKKLYDDNKLPPNWHKVISKSKKSIYYYNKVTGQSQWTIPILDVGTMNLLSPSASTNAKDRIPNNSSIVPRKNSNKNEITKISATSLKSIAKSSAVTAKKTRNKAKLTFNYYSIK